MIPKKHGKFQHDVNLKRLWHAMVWLGWWFGGLVGDLWFSGTAPPKQSGNFWYINPKSILQYITIWCELINPGILQGGLHMVARSKYLMVLPFSLLSSYRPTRIINGKRHPYHPQQVISECTRWGLPRKVADSQLSTLGWVNTHQPTGGNFWGVWTTKWLYS